MTAVERALEELIAVCIVESPEGDEHVCRICGYPVPERDEDINDAIDAHGEGCEVVNAMVVMLA